MRSMDEIDFIQKKKGVKEMLRCYNVYDYPKKFAFFHLIFAAMAITHPQVTIYQLIH